MKNFFIFLDIDGVLYDWQYILAEIDAGRIDKFHYLESFKPESIHAVNFLIENLQKNYDVNLVISSVWRSNMPYTIEKLKENGLVFDEPIQRTQIDNQKRGKQILDFLSDKTNYDYLIIDDEDFDFAKYFDQSRIIKCDSNKRAFDKQMAKDFLRNLERSQKTEVQEQSFER